MDKIIRNGMVAVLISPDYGAGWYTWNKEFPECLYDPEIVKIVLGEAEGDIREIAENKYGDGFSPYAFDQLKVVWIPVGSRFRMEEFDGSENLIFEGEDEWLVAGES